MNSPKALANESRARGAGLAIEIRFIERLAICMLVYNYQPVFAENKRLHMAHRIKGAQLGSYWKARPPGHMINKIPPALSLACLALATSWFLLPPAHAGLFRPTGSMNTARQSHTATLLASGEVLVMGGVGSYFTNELATAELFDPATE